MTVKELINELHKMPPDAPVLVECDCYAGPQKDGAYLGTGVRPVIWVGSYAGEKSVRVSD